MIRNFKALTRFLVLAISLALLGGCFNSNGSRGVSSFKSTSLAQAILPSGSSAAFSLAGVFRSNQSPSSTLEVTTSNHEIGLFCPQATMCACRLSWTDSAGGFHEVEQPLTYVESDMARCLYTSVTPGTSFFDVKLTVTGGGTTSDAVRVNMGAFSSGTDPSLASNYNFIQRYICRDYMRIAKNQNSSFYLENTLLDPRLWSMGYGIDFYTYSLGLDYGAVYSSDGNPVGWECPPIPNDTSFGPEFDLSLYSVDKIDLNNPLLTNVATGDNTIYPSSDNLFLNAGVCITGEEAGCEKYKLNRHDFYLASFRSGAFSQQICMIHKVTNVTKQDSDPNYKLDCGIDLTKGEAVLGSPALGKDIMGFAAIPDTNQNCPGASVTIPAGKKWAKLWHFRAGLPTRTIQDANTNLGQQICATRKKECQGGSSDNGANTLSVCHNFGTTGTGPYFGPLGVSQGFGNCNSQGTIGDNWAPTLAYSNAGGACTTGSYNCCRDDYNLQSNATRRAANYTAGGDYCNFSLTGSFLATSAGGLAKDNWLVSVGGSTHSCIEADTNASGKFALSFPDPLGAYQLSPRPLETNSRFDDVFVVTPTRVNVENMQNPNDPLARQFMPVRYLNGSSTPIAYMLESGSSNLPTDPNDPNNRMPVYPLCVLQDTK